MGIFTVAQGNRGSGGAGEPVGDGGIVGGGAGEDLLGEGAAPVGGEVAGVAQGGENGGIIGGVGQDDDVGMIFSGGTEHGRAADVDVFDGGRLLEGVEVDADEVDGGDAELIRGGGIFGEVAALEDSAVYFRVKRFNPSIKNFGMAGEGGDIDDGEAGVAESGGGAAGGEDFDAEGGEAAGEVEEANFVGNTEEGALDFHDGGALCHGRRGKGRGKMGRAEERSRDGIFWKCGRLTEGADEG